MWERDKMEKRQERKSGWEKGMMGVRRMKRMNRDGRERRKG